MPDGPVGQGPGVEDCMLPVCLVCLIVEMRDAQMNSGMVGRDDDV